MKRFLLFALLFSASAVSAQVEFYLDDVIVDNAVVGQVELDNQQTSSIGVVGFKNISNDTLMWHIKQCRMNDDPNIVGSYIYMIEELDPFGGIGVTYNFVTLPCWELNSGVGTQVELFPNEKLLYQNVLIETGPGCEAYRYFLMAGAVKVDSIDVNYCSTLELQNNNLSGFSVYPNPAQDEVTIETNGSKVLVSIYNIQGELLKRVDDVTSKSIISLIDLASGVYLIELVSDDKLVDVKKIQIH